MDWRVELCAVVATFSVLGAVVPLAAQDEPSPRPAAIEAALERYQAADFSGALELVVGALENVALDIEALREVATLRALCEFALDRDDALRSTLTQLAQLEVDLDERAPPPLVERYEAVRASAPPLELRVEAVVQAGDIVLRATPEDGGSGVVREVELFVRGPDGSYEAVESGVRVPWQRSLSYYGELRGPGGALVGAEGSPESPKLLLIGPAAPPVDVREAPPAAGFRAIRDEEEGSTGWVPWVILAAGLLATGAVVLVLALGPETTHEVRAPTFPTAMTGEQ